MLRAASQAWLRIWHRLMQHLRDPYRPELHYMRGPGPKYLLRHPAGAKESGDARGDAAKPPTSQKHTAVQQINLAISTLTLH
jgi:hypothetical protein